MTPAAIIDFVTLAAIWGASFLFMRLGVVEFGFVATAAMRVTVATAFLLPLLLARGQGRLLRRHWPALTLVGVLNSALPFLLYSFALLAITTGLSAILNATLPLFGAVIAWSWLKERLTASRIAGLVLGFAGVAMLAWDKASFQAGASGVAPAWAVLACLLATVCYGFAASAAKRYLAGVPPLVTATGSQLAASVALAVPAACFWPAQTPGARAWLTLGVVGVLCTGVAYILYFRLIEQAGPARAVAVTFVVPAFAILYGGLFLGERVTPWMLGCGAVIVCGTALATGLLKLPALRVADS
jgi:drug/metabolite transporter (DMT)-like permease